MNINIPFSLMVEMAGLQECPISFRNIVKGIRPIRLQSGVSTAIYPMGNRRTIVAGLQGHCLVVASQVDNLVRTLQLVNQRKNPSRIWPAIN